MVVVVNGRQSFNRKIRNPDAFRSKHSSYNTVVLPTPFSRALKSCTTSTSQMPAVYFILLQSSFCLSVASTRSTRYVQTAKLRYAASTGYWLYFRTAGVRSV